MNRIIYAIARVINLLSLVCIGAYTAVAIEYGLDTTITVGIVFSAILTALTFYVERKAIEQ